MEQEKYLIAFDLDDTVVRKLTNISDLTVEVMEKLQDMGHYIMPATARPLHLVDWVVEKIKPKAPVAMLNGAYLYDFNKNIDVYEPILITPAMVEEIWDYFRIVIGEENIYDVVSEQRELIVTSDGERDKYSSYTEHIKEKTRHEYRKISEPMLCEGFARFTIYPKVEYADKITAYLNEKYPDYHCERVDWNGVAGEMKTRLYFLHKECNKWYAIKKAAAYLGVDEKNIITFGDQWNDRLMLVENDKGYALKGSFAETFANNVTEFPCKEDGVARELIKIFGL